MVGEKMTATLQLNAEYNVCIDFSHDQFVFAQAPPFYLDQRSYFARTTSLEDALRVSDLAIRNSTSQLSRADRQNYKGLISDKFSKTEKHAVGSIEQIQGLELPSDTSFSDYLNDLVPPETGLQYAMIEYFSRFNPSLYKTMSEPIPIKVADLLKCKGTNLNELLGDDIRNSLLKHEIKDFENSNIPGELLANVQYNIGKVGMKIESTDEGVMFRLALYPLRNNTVPCFVNKLIDFGLKGLSLIVPDYATKLQNPVYHEVSYELMD